VPSLARRLARWSSGLSRRRSRRWRRLLVALGVTSCAVARECALGRPFWVRELAGAILVGYRIVLMAPFCMRERSVLPEPEDTCGASCTTVGPTRGPISALWLVDFDQGEDEASDEVELLVQVPKSDQRFVCVAYADGVAPRRRIVPLMRVQRLGALREDGERLVRLVGQYNILRASIRCAGPNTDLCPKAVGEPSSEAGCRTHPCKVPVLGRAWAGRSWTVLPGPRGRVEVRAHRA
jgi:hypothetical protein